MSQLSSPAICPACKDSALHPAELEPLLPAHRCGKCGGNWIRGEQYFRWLELPDRRQHHPQAQDISHDSAHDSVRAMLCPECGRLLGRYRVGHGLDFCIDRCAGCGGVWLDANEWQSLERSQLTDRIHFIFSAAWQAQVLRDHQHRAAEQRMVERIGATDFARLVEMTRWIEQHQHRDQVAAYLLEQLRGMETRKH
jgi:Zn-finger nucleic acid-binding protein